MRAALREPESSTATRKDPRPAQPMWSTERSLLALCATAFSVTYAFLTVALGSQARALLSSNALDRHQRTLMLGWLVAVPACTAVAGVVHARKGGTRARAELAFVAGLTLPLAASGFLPALLAIDVPASRELPFLIVAGLLALTTRWTVRVALSAPWPWQAHWHCPRLPRPTWDVATLTAVGAYIALTSFASIRLHDKLLTSNFDLGLFENLFYNTMHGAHGEALARPYFGEHAEFILYPLLPIYAAIPRTETLLVIQSALLGATAIPLYLLGRRWLGAASAFMSVIFYLLHPAVHGPNFYDFHFLTLSTFFVAWAAYWFVTRRWPLFWTFVALALSCREDVALGGTAIGLGLVLIGRRRVGFRLAALSLAWFVTVKFLWMRQFGGPAFAEYYQDLIPEGERGFVGVVRTALTHPLSVVFAVLREKKLQLGLHLLVPLAFLPLLQRRTAFLLMPGFLVLGLSTNHDAILQIHFHYVCHFVPYLFLAFLVALAVRPRRERLAWMAGAAMGTAICTAHFGALFRAKYKASYHEVSFDWTSEDASQLRDLEALVARIPPHASVAAGEYEGPRLARRRYLFSIKDGGTHNADFVLCGLRSYRWGGVDAVIEALETGTYGVVEKRGTFALLRKGYATDDNDEFLAWLRERI